MSDYVAAVALAYDFSTSGPGPYTINLKSRNAYHYVSGGRISTLLVETGVSSYVFNVSRSIASKARATLKSEPDTEGCEDWQHNAVRSAIPHAKQYVAHAIAFVLFFVLSYASLVLTVS